jgi:CubicO group peptidase (beta-lactamase class C family)
VAISKRGRFECLAGYGAANDRTGARNTADTVFSIGSVSKAFTAASILRLVEDGKLGLDETVGTLVPAVVGQVAGATVRQLLLHTSGLSGSIGNDHQPLGRDAAIAAINRLELAFPPGTKHLYSNAGYSLLAIIIELRSGTTYRDYTRSKTAAGFWDGQPAAPGPRAVGYLEDGTAGQSGDFTGPHWALDGNGDLAMTPRALATWTHALFTGRVVSPASVAVIGGPGHDIGGGRRHTPGWVGFAASVHGKAFLATAGGGGDVGQNVVVVWIPEGEQVIVFASNKPVLTAENLVETLLPSLLTGGPLPTPATPTGSAGPAAIVGKYALATGGTLTVTAQLKVSAGGADAVGALFPPSARFRDHEQRVLALLSGRTREGREERKALESEHGPISKVALGGTAVRDGETRTYVTITARGKAMLGWYALNDNGDIEGVEVPTTPPALALVPVGGSRYRPDDPTGSGPDVTVEFHAGTLTISTPAGTTVARRAG